VEELMLVKKQLEVLLGKEFVLQAEEDKSMINVLVAQNIDFKKPMDGEVIYRMRQLAKERNIQYEPSHDARIALNNYLDFKGVNDPMEESVQKAKAQPYYNPNAQMPPPNLPPPGDFGHFPPGGNAPVPNHQPPAYAPLPDHKFPQAGFDP